MDLLTDLATVNDAGGIQAMDTRKGAFIYLAPGDILHTLAGDGIFGPVAPYAPPAAPPSPPKYANVDVALAALAVWTEAFLAPLSGGRTPVEMMDLAAQAAAARAYVAGTASEADRAWIEADADLTGEDPGDLASALVAAADDRALALPLVSGLRRKLTAQLRAAPDPALLEGILLGGIVEAHGLAVSAGLADLLGVDDPGSAS